MWTRASLVLMWTGLVIVESGDVVKTDTKNDDGSKIIYPNDLLLHHQHSRTSGTFHPNNRSFPTGFQHDPRFHHNHAEFPPNSHHHLSPNSYNEVLKDHGQGNLSRNVPKGKSLFNNDSLAIPLDFLRDINQYSVDYLLHNFVEGDVDVDEPFIKNRFATEDGTARNSAIMPMKAACIPEYRTLKLVNNDDPSILYIPQCTRVEQCGGCCTHTLLSCQPIETETILYQVMKTQYMGNKRLKFLGKEIIPVEKHTKCKCDCTMKKENCNKYQEYSPADCTCTCKNIDEEEKCHRNPEKKLWNPNLCACQCREVFQCSTGSYFDQNECKCSPMPLKRQYATYEIRVHDTEVPPAEYPYEEGN